MPQNVPAPVISKRKGRPVAAAELPASKRRQVFDIGQSIMQREYKPAERTLDYLFDLMRALEPDEDITSCESWAEGASLVVTFVQFSPYAVVVWVAAGGDKYRGTVYIEIRTSKGRVIRFQFAVVTEGTAPEIVTLSLTGVAEIVVGYQHPDKQPEPVQLPTISVTPKSLQFPITLLGSTAGPETLVMQNTGEVPVYLRTISVDAPFYQRNTSDEVLQPGDKVDLQITFTPVTAGDWSAALDIDINDGGKQYATFTGQAESSMRLRTSGSQFVRGAGETVRLRSINWFGAESDVFCPHGLWVRGYKSIADQIKAMGFNCVRLPFSGDLLAAGRSVPTGVINMELNPDLDGKSAIDVFRAVIDYFTSIEVYVVLDHHRRTAGAGADGSPVSGSYTVQAWIANWLKLAAIYGDNTMVVGADLHNEPHDLTWSAWASYAEQCGNAIHAVAPDWIVIVEGVGTNGGDSYWWGGQLAGVATRPVRLQKANRLAYSPHEYGQSVGQQSWLAYDGQALPLNWPMNLYSVWRKYWGFIVEQNIAPVWVGEFGGHFGTNGTGVTGTAPHAEYESQWLYHLSNYLNGDFNGDGTTDIAAGAQGISFSFWSFNPNSGDTGGIVQDDWTTPQALKLRLLDSIMAGIPLDYLTSLNPISATQIADGDLLLVNHNGSDYSIRVSEFMALTRNKTFEPGTVHWFASAVDPNVKYLGQTWARVPAPEKYVKIAKANDTDILTTGGSDSITIGKNNLPAAQLSVTGSISDAAAQNLTTGGGGGHYHLAGTTGSNGRYGTEAVPADYGYSGSDNANQTTMPKTSSVPDHTHGLIVPGHGHGFNNGKTENMGAGEAINNAPAYVKLAAWYRVS